MLARATGAARRGLWEHVKQGPPDVILGVAAAFRADKRANKVNLSIGAYRDDKGKPVVLDCVRKATQSLISETPHPGHEYLPISGLPTFIKASRDLAFGPDGSVVPHAQVATVQALSGTGSIRVAAEFLKRWYRFPTDPSKPAPVYLPVPTWGNHKKIMADAGFADVRGYKYYDPATHAVNCEALIADVLAAPKGSVFLFHACAHNPTGADPSRDDWERIHDACARRGHLVVFDSAYQGFASGDPDRDVWALREFSRRSQQNSGAPQVVLCQSFAKNMGLYGERVGALSVVCGNSGEAGRVVSQLEQVIRPMYSSPPAWGARIAAAVLGDKKLATLWRKEVRGMADRIGGTRTMLVDALRDAGSRKDWSFVLNQIGMFSFTGLNTKQCEVMTNRHAIFLTADGRISMAGLNKGNVAQVARAIHQVTSDC